MPGGVSPPWHRGYQCRSALERIYRRIDHDFEQYFLRGRARLQMRPTHAVAVMMAMALGHVRAGRTGYMRSLVGAIPDTG